MGENEAPHLLRQALGVSLACDVGDVGCLPGVRGGAVQVTGQPQRIGRTAV